MEVADPHGQTVVFRIFPRDIADPAAAIKKFCMLHNFVGARETCALEIERGLAPELERLRERWANPVYEPPSMGTSANVHSFALVHTSVRVGVCNHVSATPHAPARRPGTSASGRRRRRGS